MFRSDISRKILRKSNYQELIQIGKTTQTQLKMREVISIIMQIKGAFLRTIQCSFKDL